MKYLDKVKLIKDREIYKKYNIYQGMIGTIIDAEIRDNCFHVIFVDKNMINDDIFLPIKIEDLELVKDNNTSDDLILEAIPKNNPKWWCKVEDGFITNLLGEKKNKIPYDYNS